MPDLIHRTWIYCRDIDNNYRGLVEGRNGCFDRYGLTPESHFIASTGIEGCTELPGRLLHMDSLGIAGLEPGRSGTYGSAGLPVPHACVPGGL